MDTSDPDITFDIHGVCNHCLAYRKNEAIRKADKAKLSGLVEKIKKDGRGKEYDCILGLSGGVDSSMCLHYLRELGLRPLTYSMDNGWNTPESDENIMRITEAPGKSVPFERLVLDLYKFRELQTTFIQSGTANVEIPTDHILTAAAYRLADKHKVKYIISGGNLATESIMPVAWGYQPRDLVHIKGVYKYFTGKNLDGLPTLSLARFNWYKHIKGIKTINLLDYYEYNREESIALLQEEYGYKSYGEKHCENYFTQWHMGCYLPKKFGFDKRRAHYSALINSGQMKRDEALEELKEPPKCEHVGLEANYWEYPTKSYKDYPNDEKTWEFLSKVVKLGRKIRGNT